MRGWSTWTTTALGGLVLVGGAVGLSAERLGDAATPPAIPRAASSSRATLPPPPSPLDLAARAPATDVRLALAKDGHIGAWLIAGPYRSSSYGIDHKPKGPEVVVAPPVGIDEAAITPKLGQVWGESAAVDKSAPPKWEIASRGDGPIDLTDAVGTKEHDLIAYAAGTLHLETSGRFYLLVGADDGLRVFVDGKPVFTRDEFRPQRDDDDMISLDLAAGDHPIVLKLHQREGGWALETRLVDATTSSAPVGAYVALAGTTADDARALAAKMASVSIDRRLDDDGYHPTLTARFPNGAPRGVPLTVATKLVRAERTGDKSAPFAATADAPILDVTAGEAPLDASGVGELVALLPPFTAAADFAKLEDDDWMFDSTVAGRHVRASFHPRRAVREAVAHYDRVKSGVDAAAPWLAPGSLDSAEHLRERLVAFVGRGDADDEALASEAAELEDDTKALEGKRDPYAARTGPMRRAYRSPADGQLSEFGFYAPPNMEEGRKYPLIVALHGMNGYAMSMLRWLFGYDDPGRDQAWEERHMPDLPRLPAFVVSPEAHGNAMYRTVGEADVMRIVAWAMANYPIDPAKVTITGPSMGGIGTAALAFHHPDVFAAAEPLCGYHSYFIRRDYGGRPVRPWEKQLADFRSNVSWAYNGMRIPLFIVHGTKDKPEENSGVLIDRYKDLGYSVKHEHPDLGHNVWSKTYEGLKGASWLLWNRRALHPKSVRLRTSRLRFADNAWVHIEEIDHPGGWGQIEARVRRGDEIVASTRGVAALRFDRDGELLDASTPVTVNVDETPIVFADGEALELHHDASGWHKGPLSHAGIYKHGNVTGPIDDAFHEPMLFVYGASDPAQARANEEVARSFAAVRWGVRVSYPVMSDVEFFARGEAVANDHALFLVGNAKSNRVVRDIEDGLPIKVDGDAVVIAGKRITGSQVGAAFIRPNPKRPDRYVVVVEGVDALGTWRAMSLPSLLPDFVVYDEGVAPARGQQLLSGGYVRAGGLFDEEWALPADISDPSAREQRADGAKSEHDATPYLP